MIRLLDFRWAARQFRRAPGFAIGAVLSLALGMTVATAVYSVVDAVLLRPLPFPDAKRLAYFVETERYGISQIFNRVPAQVLLSLRSDGRTIGQIAAWTPKYAIIGESGAARSVSAVSVTDDFFRVLGVRPQLGRVFTSSDAEARVVILSHALWSSQFGADPSIIGRVLSINGTSYSVGGVMGPTFDFPRRASLWFFVSDGMLAREAAMSGSGLSTYSTMGRLADGVTFENATALAATVYSRAFREQHQRSQLTLRAMPLTDGISRGLRSQLELWTVAAVLIMLVCAVNFATLSLSRGMRRRAETAIRAALGATRGQLIRPIIVEAVMLAVAGGLLSVVFAGWFLSFSRIWFADGALPVEPSIDWSTLLFGVVATALVGVVFALLPALDLARVDVRQMLAGDSHATTSRRGDLRGRRALVALQMTFALGGIAIVSAILQADKRWQAHDTGIEHSGLVLADIHGPPREGARYALEAFAYDSAPPVATSAFFHRLRGVPGITEVAIIGDNSRVSLWRVDGTMEERPWYPMHATPNLFRVLGVPLLAGRLPTEDEQRAGASWVVGQWFAERFAGSVAGAVGLRLQVKRVGRPKETITITGVVGPHGGSALSGLAASIYVFSDTRPAVVAKLVARVQGDAQLHMNQLARVLAEVDSRAMVTNVRTATSLIDAHRGATRGRTLFLGAVAILAIALAVTGVYSLTAYTTQLRAREFGIRAAVGADSGTIARTVLRDLWWMALLSIVVGMFVSGRTVAFLDALYRNPLMPGPLVTLRLGPSLACVVTLVLVTLVGSAVPVWRLLKMDVVRALQGGN